MKRSSSLALLTFVLVVSVSVVYAGPNKTPKDWKQPTWKVTRQQFDVISAVSSSSGTVSIRHTGGTVKQERDLKTSSFTEVFVDGQKSSLSSLKAGMHVTYTLGMDGETISRIENVAPQQAAPTPVATATPSFPTNAKQNKR